MSQTIFKKLKLALMISAISIGSAFAGAPGSLIDLVIKKALSSSDSQIGNLVTKQTADEAIGTITTILSARSVEVLGKQLDELTVLTDEQVIRLLNVQNDPEISRLLNTSLDELQQADANKLFGTISANAVLLARRADSGIASCSLCASGEDSIRKAIAIDPTIQKSLKAKYPGLQTEDALGQEVNALLVSPMIQKMIQDGEISASTVSKIRRGINTIEPDFQQIVLGAFHAHQVTGVAGTDAAYTKALLQTVLRFGGDDVFDNQLLRIVIDSERSKTEWVKILNQAMKKAKDEGISNEEAFEKLIKERAIANGMEKEWEEVNARGLCRLMDNMRA